MFGLDGGILLWEGREVGESCASVNKWDLFGRIREYGLGLIYLIRHKAGINTSIEYELGGI